MSAQLLTLNGLEHTFFQLHAGAAKQGGARGRAAVAGPSDAERSMARRCALGLACIPIMLVLTIYVDVLRGPLVMLVGVFATFYIVLYAGLYAPLRACSRYARATLPQARAPGVAFRFNAIAIYVLCAWHTFPVVWATELLGGVSPQGARMGYLVADVLAKFLPVSLYISSTLDDK